MLVVSKCARPSSRVWRVTERGPWSWTGLRWEVGSTIIVPYVSCRIEDVCSTYIGESVFQTTAKTTEHGGTCD